MVGKKKLEKVETIKEYEDMIYNAHKSPFIIVKEFESEKDRACAALCPTRRHFIKNRQIHAKLCEKLPYCVQNKKP